MEDHFNILINIKRTFILILDLAQNIMKKPKFCSDDAQFLIELIKEFYMNYPLKGQNPSTTCSNFNETDFYTSINDTENLNENIIEESVKEEGSAKEFYEAVKKFVPTLDQCINTLMEKRKKSDSISESKNNIIYFGYKNEAILSIVKSSYLSSKIIIRDITGKHAWNIMEHRVIRDLNMSESNDIIASYINMLELKEYKELKEYIIKGKDISCLINEEENAFKQLFEEIIKSEPSIDEEKMKEELKYIRKNNILFQALEILCKHSKGATKVIFIVILV